jgi:multidrug efflux system outer membrane protein
LQAQYALLNLVKDTIKTYQDSYNITKKSYDAGSVNAMLLAQSNTALQGAKVSLASVEAAVKTSKNTLRALVGGAVDDNLLKPIPLDSKITAFIPDGVDSETLLRRPDILMAEHALKAADANIDAARAAFFPSISLTGTAGYASNDLDNLFKNTSEMWSFKPSIYLPIFNSGKLSANLDYATLMQNSKMAAYEQSIINAFTEVSGVLDNKKMIEDQLKAHSELLKTSNEYYKLAKTRYDNGVDSYLTLLDAQRNLFSVQQNYVQQKTGQLVNSISLYKVLGGGF